MKVWVVKWDESTNVEGVFLGAFASKQAVKEWAAHKQLQVDREYDEVIWFTSDYYADLEEVEGYEPPIIKLFPDPPHDVDWMALERVIKDARFDGQMMILEPWEGYISEDGGETYRRIPEVKMEEE